MRVFETTNDHVVVPEMRGTKEIVAALRRRIKTDDELAMKEAYGRFIDSLVASHSGEVA